MIKGAKVKITDIKRNWHLIDAKEKVLGRLASEIAQLLQGKNKPYYVPHLDCGDYVVVINAKDVRVTGNKRKAKVYYSHSNFPGGLKTVSFEELWKKNPEEIVRKAVWGMMPKNRLGRQMIKKLRVFGGAEHPYQDKFKNLE